MNTKEFKFNCSNIGALMGNAQGNSPVTDNEFKTLFSHLGRDWEELSELQKLTARDIMLKEINYEPFKLSDTTTSELAKIYAYEMYGKSKLSKGNDSPFQLEKGILSEPDAISMLSEYDGVKYTKNEELFQNKWFKGIPDVLVRTTSGKVSKIIEIKTSFDLPSFLLAKSRKEDSDNLFEVMGYMDMLSCQSAEIVHILVDMPKSMVIREEKRMTEYYKSIGFDSKTSHIKISQIKQSMVFPEFSLAQKIFRIPVTLNKLSIKDAKTRVTRARKWIANMHDTFTKPVTLQK